MSVIKAVPTLEPLYAMRDQAYLPVVVNDLLKATVLPPEKYILQPTLEDVKAFTATEFAFDLETTNWKFGKPQITMVGLCAEMYKAMVVPFRGAYLQELKRIFSNATVLVGHNLIQYDVPLLFEALGLEWSA